MPIWYVYLDAKSNETKYINIYIGEKKLFCLYRTLAFIFIFSFIFSQNRDWVFRRERRGVVTKRIPRSRSWEISRIRLNIYRDTSVDMTRILGIYALIVESQHRFYFKARPWQRKIT